MPIFDTHAHYQDEAFDEDRHFILNELPKKNVCGIINAATDVQSSKKVMELSKQYPYCFAAVGVHPSDILRCIEDGNGLECSLKTISEYYQNDKTVAIGEIGLEYHYDYVPKELQLQWFEKQVALSKELDAPIIVHDREAHEDTMNILKKYQPKGVVHCFSGSVEMMREVCKLGMYIGLGGAVTFKNAKKPVDVACSVPLDKLLLETDAPYMSPVPFRGTRCDSSMIQQTALLISSFRDISVESLLTQTTNNAIEAFPKLKKLISL